VLEFKDLETDVEFELPKKTELTMNNFMKTRKMKKKPTKVKHQDTPSISPESRYESLITQYESSQAQETTMQDLVDSDDEHGEPNEGDGFVPMKSLGPLEINVVEGERGAKKKKRRGKVTIDSGAEVSIWPAAHVAWENVVPTKESEMGIGFVAANGSRMNNYGGTQVTFEKNGKTKAMNFEVTDCKKPLASVAKIVDKGNKVVFDKDESYILNKLTGEKIILERERGTFVMVVDFEVDDKDLNEASCFHRLA
jgi:hypothetical protein